MMQGWVKFHRQMLENPIVTKDAEHLAIWTYLLLQATHTEYPALFKGGKIILKQGQLITGSISIGNRLKISESKVRRVLKAFENDGQIERQTSNKNSLISILSWERYQTFDGQVTDKCRTTDDKQECNNVKNENSIKYGEFANVILSDQELLKLKEKFPKDYEDRIEKLSSYMQSKGKRYKSHYATILNWARKERNDGVQGKLKAIRNTAGNNSEDVAEGNCGLRFI